MVIGDSQWESRLPLSETLLNMAERGDSNYLTHEEHEGVITCFCAVLINTFISPAKEHTKNS